MLSSKKLKNISSGVFLSTLCKKNEVAKNGVLNDYLTPRFCGPRQAGRQAGRQADGRHKTTSSQPKCLTSRPDLHSRRSALESQSHLLSRTDGPRSALFPSGCFSPKWNGRGYIRSLKTHFYETIATFTALLQYTYMYMCSTHFPTATVPLKK